MDHQDLVARIEAVLNEASANGLSDHVTAERIVDTLVPIEEPPVGSVVVVNGPRGTAYQRFHSDGVWHSANGYLCSWETLVERSSQPVIVVHIPPGE